MDKWQVSGVAPPPPCCPPCPLRAIDQKWKVFDFQPAGRACPDVAMPGTYLVLGGGCDSPYTAPCWSAAQRGALQWHPNTGSGYPLDKTAGALRWLLLYPTSSSRRGRQRLPMDSGFILVHCQYLTTVFPKCSGSPSKLCHIYIFCIHDTNVSPHILLSIIQTNCDTDKLYSFFMLLLQCERKKCDEKS
jgi:hypothetical protein